MRSSFKKSLAVVTATSSLMAASVAPAFAQFTDAGEEPGAGLSILQTLTYFVGGPAAIWFTVWLLWSLPKWRKEAKPTTGEQWDPKPGALTK